MTPLKNKTAVSKKMGEGKDSGVGNRFLKGVFILVIFKLGKLTVGTLTNKLTSSAALSRLGSGPAVTPRGRHLWLCQQPFQDWVRGGENASHSSVSVQSLTQEIGLCYSAGSFTTFSWEAKGSSSTTESWQLPKGNACLVMEGGWLHAVEKRAFSLWFSQGSREQKSKNDTISLILVWSSNSKGPQYDTGTTITQLQALLRREENWSSCPHAPPSP